MRFRCIGGQSNSFVKERQSFFRALKIVQHISQIHVSRPVFGSEFHDFAKSRLSRRAIQRIDSRRTQKPPTVRVFGFET
jgi:hypothetical protein